MMLRMPLALASPAGRRGRLSILIFHRVLPEPDPLFPELPSAAEFEARMRWIRTWFNVLPLGEAVERLYAGTIASRALAITFDDGYADNEELAAPILRHLGLPATFFIATGFLDGATMFNDQVIEAIRGCRHEELDLSPLGLPTHRLRSAAERKRAIEAILQQIKHLEQAQRQAAADMIVRLAGTPTPPRLMMRPDQVRSLRAQGMEIGAHTVTHPILTRLPADAALGEMMRGKRELEAIVGEPVRLFAYPNGVPRQDYAAEHARMARECGFSAAVSTAWGAASARSDRYQLPRFTPWDTTRLRFGARLLANFRAAEAVAA
jgi:peptidoglycan/xylan/chitin deacetylase (PgdA/CDA1 family)